MTSYPALIIPAIGFGAILVVIMTVVLVPWLQRSRDLRTRQRPLSLDLSAAGHPIRENYRRPTSSTP